MSQLLIERPELMLDPEGLGPDDELRLQGALGELASALGHGVVQAPGGETVLARAASGSLGAQL